MTNITKDTSAASSGSARHNILLIGFMGTGKSSIAAYLSEVYHMEAVEMDEIIVKREGMSIPDIFATKGETYFRRLETALLKELQLRDSLIISCGGGTAMREENVKIMKENGYVVLLTATPATIFSRIGEDTNRPLLEGRRSIEGIAELMEQRRSHYENAAQITISTDDRSLAEITAELNEKLNQMPDWNYQIPWDLCQSNLKNFETLLMMYRCAIREIRTKLEVLDEEFSSQYNRNPISFITTRVKKPMSIRQKLLKKGYAFTEENVFRQLNDVAGIRVICPFIDDIYTIAQLLMQQDDIRVIEIKDYIKHPKPNGYRSYHLILEIPVFFSSGKTPIRAEVQIRTIGMDFWASLEHQLRYKKRLDKIEGYEEISARLQECSHAITHTDNEMQEIKEMIGDFYDI